MKPKPARSKPSTRTGRAGIGARDRQDLAAYFQVGMESRVVIVPRPNVARVLPVARALGFAALLILPIAIFLWMGGGFAGLLLWSLGFAFLALVAHMYGLLVAVSVRIDPDQQTLTWVARVGRRGRFGTYVLRRLPYAQVRGLGLQAVRGEGSLAAALAIVEHVPAIFLEGGSEIRLPRTFGLEEFGHAHEKLSELTRALGLEILPGVGGQRITFSGTNGPQNLRLLSVRTFPRLGLALVVAGLAIGIPVSVLALAGVGIDVVNLIASLARFFWGDG